MTASFPKRDRKRFVVALLGGTILTAVAMPAAAQEQASGQTTPTPPATGTAQSDATRPGQDVIRTIAVGVTLGPTTTRDIGRTEVDDHVGDIDRVNVAIQIRISPPGIEDRFN